MSNQPQDLEVVVNALLSQLKQQGKPSKLPTQQTWVERYLAPPKSLSEIIWRVCWLLVVPGIFIRLWLPISDWCWHNGLPLVTGFVWLTVGGLYWLVYHFAVTSPAAHSMRRLLDVQFAIPLGVVWFVICWETLSHGQ